MSNYRQKTAHYGIPFITEGEKISAGDEKLGKQIIENQILGIMDLYGDGVISEGEYRVSKQEKCVVVSLIGSGKEALFAILNKGVVKRYLEIEWVVEEKKKVFLWVEQHQDQYKDPSLIVSKVGVDRPHKKHILLAELDNTGEEPQINTMIKEKRWVKEFVK